MINNAYLKSDTSKKGDEVRTPFYAVDPILKYLDKNKIIWCPFDDEKSAFVRLLKENGYKVINTHIKNGQDFFNWELWVDFKFDVIISNPPFSTKDKVLETLFDINRPFMMLLPINSLQGKKRVEMFIGNDIQLLVFDARIGYHKDNLDRPNEGNCFGSAYFCRDILPYDLIFKKLTKYERSL